MVNQIKQRFQIVKSEQYNDYICKVFEDDKIIYWERKNDYQQARLAAIQYLKDHQ